MISHLATKERKDIFVQWLVTPNSERQNCQKKSNTDSELDSQKKNKRKDGNVEVLQTKRFKNRSCLKIDVKYEPDNWDIIISNPPFKKKRQFFERALSFNKPFALIMTNTWLNDAYSKKVFMEAGRQMQLLMFDKRMKFINPDGRPNNKITFSSSYFCSDFFTIRHNIRGIAMLNINLFGGPCIGKSSAASQLFNHFKSMLKIYPTVRM